MKKRLLVILLFISILLNVVEKKVYGADLKDNFVRIGTEQGLSSSEITAIYQDIEGYMWIGTSNGLNKYNGYDVVVYNYDLEKSEGLSSTFITAILEDGDYLWVGTKNGLNLLNTKTDKITNIAVNINDDTALTDSKITTIFKDSFGQVWVGTSNGLNKYNKDTKTFERYLVTSEPTRRLESNYVTCIEEFLGEYLLVGTKHGTSTINLKTEFIEEIPNEINNERYIYSIEDDKDNLLWLATDNGIFTYDYSSRNLQKFTLNIQEDLNTNIENIYCDNDGYIWFAGSNGAIRYRKESNTYTIYKNKYYDNYSISNDYIRCIYEDNNNNIWIGTQNGLNILNNYTEFITRANLNSKYRNVTALGKDSNDNIWFGTLYNGLLKYSVNENLIEHIYYNNNEDLLNTNSINEIILGKDNNLIVATKSGILIIDENNGDYNRLSEEQIQNAYKEEIFSVYLDCNEVLWIGSRYGFYSYNMNTEEFIDYSNVFKSEGIASLIVTKIYPESSNSNILWLGGNSSNGLIKFNKETKEIERFINRVDDEEIINYDLIRSIVSDKNGDIWIGTDCNLSKFEVENNKFINYTENDGLASNYIKSLVYDKINNFIWLTTNKGISRYSIDEDNFENYTSINGIADNNFMDDSSILVDENHIIFGGDIGLTYFCMSEIQDKDKENLKVSIDSIRVDDIKQYSDKNIKLKYNSNSLAIKFFTNNYIEKEKITYEYMLEGVDGDWVHSNYNFARYVSLEPGNYVFKVVAKNDGEESNIATINITINKPFWQTKFAYVIYFLIIAIILFLIINYVKILEGLVKERTGELNTQLEENKRLYNKIINEERFKNNFFVNLSHELRTPLNVILSTVQLVDVINNKTENNNNMKRYTNIIKKSSNSLLNIINDIIDSSKIETGHYNIKKSPVNIVYVVEETALNMSEYIKSHGIELIIDPEIEEKQINCDSVEIERIIVNLLSNAVKYTPEGGTITININDKGNYVDIIVRDTGTGISKEDQAFIFNRFKQGKNEQVTNITSSGIGLTLVKYLVELHNGAIMLESEVGKGATFIVTLPVGIE